MWISKREWDVFEKRVNCLEKQMKDLQRKYKQTASGGKRSVTYEPLILISEGQRDNIIDEYEQVGKRNFKSLIRSYCSIL